MQQFTYTTRLTIQSVHDPEKEAAQRESERDNKQQEDESRGRFQLKFDNANGIED